MCSLKRNQRNGKTEWIPFYREVTLVALVSWCATMSKLGRFALRKWPPPTRPGAPTGERPRKLDLSERIARFGDILNKERLIVEIVLRSIFVNPEVGGKQEPAGEGRRR